MQIRLHELEDHVDVLKLPGARRQHYVLDLHDICIVYRCVKTGLAACIVPLGRSCNSDAHLGA